MANLAALYSWAFVTFDQPSRSEKARSHAKVCRVRYTQLCHVRVLVCPHIVKTAEHSDSPVAPLF